MKKTIFKCVSVLWSMVLVSFQTLPVEACTSFAVYGEKTLYGMNFDFQDTDMLFSVETADGIKAFSMAFQAGDEFVPTVRMNSHGLFLSEQMQFPEMKKIKELKGNQYYIGDVASKVATFENIASVLNFIGDKQNSMLNANGSIRKVGAVHIEE